MRVKTNSHCSDSYGIRMEIKMVKYSIADIYELWYGL